MDAIQVLQHELAITQGKLAGAYMSIERVRELHRCTDLQFEIIRVKNVCVLCGIGYPCPTIKALDEE